jgi:hypothetical protein
MACGQQHFKSLSGSSACLLCPSKSHTAGLVGQTSCVCYPQYYASHSLPLTCHVCPLGAFCWEDTSCALRYIVPSNTSSTLFQLKCPGGRQIVGNWTRNYETGTYHLVDCPSNYQLLSAEETGKEEKQECALGIWSKTDCPYGYELSALKIGKEPFMRCDECGPGKECIKPHCGIVNCTYCNPGYYKDTAGTHACDVLPIQEQDCASESGLYAQCATCGLGRYLDAVPGATSCTLCPANSTTLLMNSTRVTDCLCIKGYYSNTISKTVSCSPCPNGTYADSPSLSTTCKLCPTGSTSFEGSRDKLECVCNVGKCIYA